MIIPSHSRNLACSRAGAPQGYRRARTLEPKLTGAEMSHSVMQPAGVIPYNLWQTVASSMSATPETPFPRIKCWWGVYNLKCQQNSLNFPQKRCPVKIVILMRG